MDNLNLDKILDLVNKEKNKRGLDTYIPLYPMLRIENDKLNIGVLISNENDDIWTKNTSNKKPEYWVLIDIDTSTIKEFNKTSEKDFTNSELILNLVEDNQKEISKYSLKKRQQYKGYFMEDIKNDQLPIQKRLSEALNNEFSVDGEKVNINEFLLANLDTEINTKIDELIDLLVQSKYSSITFYYENLFEDIITTYKKTNIIDKDKMNLCVEIMKNYYYGLNGIENFFNV